MDISILTHSQVSKPLFSEWLTSLLDLNWLGELWYQVIWNKIPKNSILPWHLFANKIKFNWEFCSNCDCNAHWRTSNATLHHTRCTMCTAHDAVSSTLHSTMLQIQCTADCTAHWMHTERWTVNTSAHWTRRCSVFSVHCAHFTLFTLMAASAASALSCEWTHLSLAPTSSMQSQTCSYCKIYSLKLQTSNWTRMHLKIARIKLTDVPKIFWTMMVNDGKTQKQSFQ